MAIFCFESRYPAGWWGQMEAFLKEVHRVFRDHAILFVVAALYTASLFWAGWATGKAELVSLSQYYIGNVWTLNIWFLVGLICLYALYVVAVVRPQSPTQYIFEVAATRWRVRERLMLVLPILAVMPIYLSAFTSFKILIPYAQPFVWDSAFADWDRLLHGGVQPWEILHPLLGYPLVTRAVNYIYQTWFLFMHGILLWQTVSLANPVLRLQFLLSFMLVWALVGTGMAILLSSAGPCFYGRVTGEADPYTPLMAYLHSLGGDEPIQAVRIQEWLWEIYSTDQTTAFGGISAMPSVHVAMATLFALIGWRTHRWMGVGLTAFALLIMLGSVHLGWHYALDGYIGALATLAIWRVTGEVLRRTHGAAASATPA